LLFLINLDSAEARRARMVEQLDGLGLAYRRIGADLRHRSDAEIAAWFDAHLPGLSFDFDDVSSAEIGCWASHLLAWRALADAPDVEAAAVLEDDLRLEATLPAAIATLAVSPVFDIVFLGTSSRNVSSRQRVRAGDFTIHQPVGTIYNTWGYVIAKHYVQRFFEARPLAIDRPIDHYTGGSRGRALKPRIGVLRPAPVSEDPDLGAASQIEPFTFRIDRARLVEQARRRLLASRVSELYYRLYRFL